MNGKISDLPFSEARHLLKEGGILLFRSKRIVSSLIKRAPERQYSHVAVASEHREPSNLLHIFHSDLSLDKPLFIEDIVVQSEK